MGISSNDKVNLSGNVISKRIVLDIMGNIITIILLSCNLYHRSNRTCSGISQWVLLIITFTKHACVPGVGFAYTGVIIRRKAYDKLGRFFTFDIRIRDSHGLITTGIYRYITHPGYTGVLLTYFSLLLFAHFNCLITIFMIVSTLYSFYHRIRAEETMLLQHFGEPYEIYRSTTKRFVPYLL